MPKSELRPILFNTEMVMAILNGRKTMTRRIIKPQPPEDAQMYYCFAASHKKYIGKWSDNKDKNSRLWTPPCHGDDILYVKEAFRVRDHGGDPTRGTFWAEIEYRAGGDNLILTGLPAEAESWMRSQWMPSIHMPKEAVRIFLKVKTVSVERLRDITPDECEKEGIVAWSKDGKRYKYAPADEENDYPIWKWSDTPGTPQEAMQRIWNSTIKTKYRDCYSWDANPWVWVIEFERTEKPELKG